MFPNFCARQKDGLHSVKLFFCGSTKVFEEALNAVKFLGWHKIFGPAQNILGPVKGQGISSFNDHLDNYTCNNDFRNDELSVTTFQT